MLIDRQHAPKNKLKNGEVDLFTRGMRQRSKSIVKIRKPESPKKERMVGILDLKKSISKNSKLVNNSASLLMG